MPYLPGQIVANRYRIVKLLGQGGFGAVYRAWDLNLKIPCALKENLELSPAARRQFEREATWLAGLSHPNLPRVTDHFSEPGSNPGDPRTQYLVMDFIEGQDLDHIVAQNGPVPERQAIQWITQVLNALEYLHSQTPPLVHRDVKPANIRIDPEGNPILVDFGLVKRFDPHHGTTTGAMAVSPGYSPPEQYGHGSTDARSDIYSLGATLYKLLTGVEPQESVLRIAQDEIIPAHLRNPQVSLRTSQAVQVAMAMTPAQRFSNATAFKNTLLGSMPAATLPPVNIQPSTTASQPPAPAATAGTLPLPGQGRTQITSTKMWLVIGGILLMLCVSIPTGIYFWNEFFSGGAVEKDVTRTPTRTRILPDEPEILIHTPTGTEIQLPTRTNTPVVQISRTPTLTPFLPTRTSTSTSTPPGVGSFDLAFASDRNGNFNIFLMDTTHRLNWISLAPPGGYERAWWPSFCGNYIAGEVADLDGSSPQWIYLIDPVRGSTFLWEPVTAGAGLGVPRCSPNGETLAYSSGSGSDWDLYIADLDGGSPFLVDDEGIAGYASWLPDNNRLYSMAGSGNPFIIRYATHLLQPASLNIQTVTSGKYPAVSPDGSQVAYICGEDLRLCLWNVSSGSSSTLHSITYARVNDQRMPASPAWSVDGQWIYFASADDGDWDIYRIRPNGSGIENMTSDWPTNELMPALQW
jgi:serine/threonine protein kinase